MAPMSLGFELSVTGGGSVSAFALALYFNAATITSASAPSVDTPSSAVITYANTDTVPIARQSNADGVLEYAPHNDIAVNSEDFTSGWGISGATHAAYSGTDFPSFLSGARTVTMTAGTDNKWIFEGTLNVLRAAVRAKAGTINFIAVWGDGLSTDGVFYNLLTGAVATEKGSSTGVIINEGNGWYTCITTFIAAESFVSVSFLSADDTDSNWEATGGETIHCSGVQAWTALPAPLTYISTTTAAVFAARLTYEPVTNLLSYPEQLDNAIWAATRSSLTSGQVDALGGTNAFKLVENDDDNTHFLTYANPTTFISGKVYTFEVYAKKDERTIIELEIGTEQFPANCHCYFNLVTGVVGTQGAGIDNAQIIPVTGQPDYYRCCFTATADAIGATSDFNVYLADADNSNSYDGDTTSGAIIGFMQLNEGSIKPYVGVTNLVSSDQDFTTTWTETNATAIANTHVSPDGATTGDRLDIDSGAGIHDISQAETTIVAVDYTASCFVKDDGEGFAGIHFGDETGTNFIAVIANLANQTTTTNTGSGSGTITASGADFHGNGWTEIWITGQVTSTANFHNIFASDVATPSYSNGRATFTGVAGSDLALYGAQLVPGAKQPYIGKPSTSFRRRSTADASTKSGLLIEAAATNLITDGEDLTAAAWTIGNTNSFTVTADQGIGPDDNTVLDEVKITDTTSETHYVFDTVSITTGTDYTFSAFLRADEIQFVGLNVFASNEDFITVVWDLYAGIQASTDVGSGGGSSGTINDSDIVPVGDGLYFVWVSFSIAETDASAEARIASYASASPTFNNNGLESYAGTADDAFNAGFVQFETGTSPSSYIKTSGGTVTRSADDAKETGINWYDATKGTFIHEMTPNETPTAAIDYISMDDTTANEVIAIQGDASANLDFEITDGGSSQTGGVLDSTVNVKVGVKQVIAGAFLLNDCAVSGNGSTADTDTSVTIPTVTQLTIGPGLHRQILYHNTRRDDATLAIDSLITDDGF